MTLEIKDPHVRWSLFVFFVISVGIGECLALGWWIGTIAFSFFLAIFVGCFLAEMKEIE